MSEVEPTADRRLHETLAKQINGEVWSLLDKPDRSVEEDERLVLAAHASAYHWLHAASARYWAKAGRRHVSMLPGELLTQITMANRGELAKAEALTM